MEEKDGGQKGGQEDTWSDHEDWISTKDEDQNEEAGGSNLIHDQELFNHKA